MAAEKNLKEELLRQNGVGAQAGEDLRNLVLARDRARVAAAGDDLASIGRAVGSLPEKIRTRYPAIDWDAWRADAGAGHEALWSAAVQRLPAFAGQVNLILLDITD